MSSMPKKQIECYIPFPKKLLPKGAENIFVAKADNGNHFLDFGIKEGMMLIFDADKDFVDGHPSCFENSKTQKIKLLRHKETGFKHSGKLIAAISYYED